jgi:hypothetical protein
MPTTRLSDFKGINNKSHDSKMPDGFLRQAIDCFIENSLMLVKREGLTEKDTEIFNAIWSDSKRFFAVRNGDLVEVIPNGTSYTFTTLRAGVGYMDMDFCELNGNYYYVSRAVNGIITPADTKTFGQALVPAQPTLSGATAGTLPAGTYLVATTTLDAAGMESGTTTPTSITISANKQISLSNIFVSTDPRVTQVAVYCSTANGDKLFRQSVIATGVTTAAITAVNTHNFPLGKIGTYPAPSGGHLIAYHYGHLYIAVNNFIFYSEPRPKYEQFDPICYYSFTGNITVILPLESGMWISTETDGLFWLSGKTPHQGFNVQGDMSIYRKHNACLKIGSPKPIPAEFIGNGAPANGWMATAKEGIFLLMESGSFTVETSQINMPEFTFCAGALVEDSDSFKYLAIVRGASVPTNTI